MAGAIMNRVRGGWLAIPAKRLLCSGVFGAYVTLLTIKPETGLVAALSMYLGQAPGWGRYIGALGKWETKKLKEWKPVDLILSPFHFSKFWWGWWGLSLRGLFWGVCLSLTLLSFWPACIGLLMPLFYLMTIQSCRYLQTSNPDGQGWEWGEVMFGAFLWASMVL